MREKLAAFPWMADSDRITPAYAGKTSVLLDSENFLGDHPRVFGKNFKKRHNEWRDLGSPPRMREKHLMQVDIVPCPGITPAYAGKTFLLAKCTSSLEDHPRVCGKNPPMLSGVL